VSYTEPVIFTKTGQYGCGPDSEDDVYTVAEFLRLCETKMFIDYDGYGHPVKDRRADLKVFVKPSTRSSIPKDATHVVWYNR
jgi:hypothetical protein